MKSNKTRSLILSLLTIPLLFAILFFSMGNGPSWWTDRDVLNQGTANDFAGALSGHVKWIATNAYLELEANLPNGAGTNIEDMVQAFPSTNNYQLLNVGQIKNVASNFWLRLAQEHRARTFPWTGENPNDYSAANIGQLKAAFNFDLTSDNDNDGLADSWEIGWFGSTNETASGDFDNDGANNLEEFTFGLNPDKVDTDNDGVGDGIELDNGNDPAISNSYTLLPFIEAFETDTVTTGDISNQNNWVAYPSGKAVVQTSTKYSGSQALELQASLNSATAYQVLGGANETMVWTEFYTIPARNMSTNEPLVSSSCASAFYVNSNGVIVVYDGSSRNWTTITSHTPIPTGTWTKITIRQNYANQEYAMWLDGTAIVSEVAFANPIVEYSQARFVGDEEESTFVDDLTVSGNYASLEYSIEGEIEYDGSQTGTWRIVAVSVSNSWSLYNSTSIADEGEYTISNIAGLEEYWIKAFCDRDNDGKWDEQEVWGEYSSSIYLTNNLTEIDIDIEEPDDDEDEMADWIEKDIVDDTTTDNITRIDHVLPDDDYDGDGVSNGKEIELGTDPTSASSVPPTLAFASATYLYAENAGDVQIPIELLPSASSNVTAWLSVSGGTAELGVDYQFTDQTVSFSSGTTTQDVSLTISTNQVLEPVENIILTLSDITGPAVLGRSTYVIQISDAQADTDEDGMPDWWEQTHFGGATNAVPELDEDEDEWGNLMEFLIGGNPTKGWLLDTEDTLKARVETEMEGQ